MIFATPPSSLFSAVTKSSVNGTFEHQSVDFGIKWSSLKFSAIDNAAGRINLVRKLALNITKKNNKPHPQSMASLSQVPKVLNLVIVVSIIILVGVAAFLLIKVQKCCQKIETQKISKYNIHWRS